MREIQLTRGKVALVDDEDFERLSSHKWYADPIRHTYYAKRSVRRPDGRWTSLYMHHEILGIDGKNVEIETDHVDRDGLNNQRDNLRVATCSQNRHNCRKPSHGRSSPYLGVTLRRQRKMDKWIAQIQVAGKRLYLGIFRSATEAARVRDAYVRNHPELCASQNFANNEGPT